MNRRHLLTSATAIALLPPFAPRASAQDPAAVMSERDPIAAAEYLSVLETTPDDAAIAAMYEYLHPNSQYYTSLETVTGWYRSVFQARGPQPADAYNAVALDRWTWGVNGVTYRNVAEVNFTQQFADGSVVDDVMRLVFHEGAWRWFFGRDMAFVQQQNTAFASGSAQPASANPEAELATGNAPHDLHTLTAIPADAMQRIVNEGGIQTGTDTSLSAEFVEFHGDAPWASHVEMLALKNQGAEYQDGALLYGTRATPGDAGSFLHEYLALHASRPMFGMQAMSDTPEQGLPWARFVVFENDAAGSSVNIVLVDESALIHLSTTQPALLSHIARAVLGEPFELWTWDVNGQAYTDVAAVSFTQNYAGGSTHENSWHSSMSCSSSPSFDTGGSSRSTRALR